MSRILLLLATLLCSNLSYPQQPQGAANNPNSNPNQNVTITNLEPVIELLQSIASELQADPNSNNRENESNLLSRLDLAQQTEMANRTVLMAWAAIAGTIVSIIGVALLIGNLRLTNQIVRQNRAYMTPGDRYIDIVARNHQGNVVGINLRFNWVNSGDSPALHVKAIANNYRGPEGRRPHMDGTHKMINITGTNVGRDESHGIDIYYTREEFIRFVNANDDWHAIPHILIEYSDIYGNFYRNEWTAIVRWGELGPGDLPNVELVNSTIRYELWGSQQGETSIGRKPVYPLDNHP